MISMVPGIQAQVPHIEKTRKIQKNAEKWHISKKAVNLQLQKLYSYGLRVFISCDEQGDATS